MKKLLLFTAMLAVTLSFAQDITFSFQNARNTNDGTNDYYEADVFIESTVDFKLGSGQIYFNYNTDAFGELIKTNNNFEYLQPDGSILAEAYGFPAYKDFIVNDNTASRVSTAFQQGLSSGAISENNVTSVAKHLFSIKIKYIDSSQDPMVTFESGSVFLDQFYTACGPTDATGFPDCFNFPGSQILNDTFNSSKATLSVNHLKKDTNINVRLITTTDNQLTIKYSNNLNLKNYTIHNISGKAIKHDTQETTSINNLANGLYIIQLNFENNHKVVKRFIKN